MSAMNTSSVRDNAIGSGLEGLERFSSAEVQDRLFRESIDKAVNEVQVAAERGIRADVLKIKMLARNAKDPAVQDRLRKSFADLQKQIGDSLAAARGTLDEKAALKAVLADLGRLAGPGVSLTRPTRSRRRWRAGVCREGREVRLTPGMAVTVEVKTGKRRLIEFLLSPLLRYRDESLRER